MKKLFLLLILLLATATLVSGAATMPTQQYNKIFLNPFYRANLALNTNYTYNMTVNPPDGISKVNSAIISFNLQANGQTQAYTLWVNGQSCNNPTYNIATAYSASGQLQFYFDCSNRITQAGIYTVTLRSDTNTGAISGWLDLTYMNNPLGEVLLHGTEYVPGEQGKMFLQFLDASQQPITTSACTLSIWYPNNTKLVNSSAMSYLDEGIYYYNLNVPSSIGVYPASAKCYFPAAFGNTTLLNNVTETWESNTFTGGTGWANGTNGGWDYYGPVIVANASAGTGGCYAGNYCLQISGVSQSAEYIERGFVTPQNTQAMTITFYLKSTMGNADTIEYSIFDGTWHQQEIYYGSNFTTGVWYKRNYTVSVANGYYLDSTAILQGFFGVSFTASNKYLFVDNISVSYIVTNTSISNVSAYQILMGSGEVHVSELYNRLNTTLNGTTPAAIWNYANRTLTQTITVDPAPIASAVWNATTRNLTYYPAQVDMTNYTLITQNVWTYINRTLTSAPENVTAIAVAVWTNSYRNLTYYQNFSTPQVDLTNYTLIGTYVWNATTRNLTYYPPVNNLTAADVWTYTNRNLTYYQNFSTPQIDMTNYTRIDQTIYAVNSSLSAQISGLPISIWTYVNRNLTYYAPATVDNNAIALAVWNYTNRNLTYYQNFSTPQIDMTNYTLINEGVWSYSVRNLTYFPTQTDLTNYTKISDGVWTYATRNLTYYPTQVDLTNYTNIAVNVWTYITRNLTYYAPASVDNNAVAQAVWNYSNRNLTYYQNFSTPQLDLTNYSLINEGVWTYSVRNLTYYEDKTNYTEIINTVPTAVWTYTTRNLTYYPPQVDMTNYTRIDQTIYAVNTSLYNKIVSETDLVLELVHNENNLTWIQIAGVPGSVWNYTDRNLTYYAPAFVDNNAVAIAVWNSTTRNLTYYPTQVDLTNYSLITQGVWTYIDRNLTYFPAQVDLTNYSTINSGVWTYNNRNLTYYPTATDLTNYTLINEGVWTYNNRNLTYYPTQIDLTNYSKISNLTAGEVWTYATRDLTYYQVNNISAADVWNYINRTLTYYQINNITATDVWAYNNRTLTYYPSQQDLTNYTAIWTYPDRNLTYYAPAYVNNTAVAQETWQYPVRYTHGELITG